MRPHSLVLSLSVLAAALVGCGSGEQAPSGADSMEGALKGVKAGPVESHSGPPKADDAKPKGKPSSGG